MKTIKGPAIFLAQFAGDTAPFNSLDSIAAWAAGLGYKGVQIPSWDARLFDLKKAAQSKTYCQEVQGILASHGLEITELSTHLQGQLVAVHPAYDAGFDGFAAPEVRGNPALRQKWAVKQMMLAAKASANLGLTAHVTFSGALTTKVTGCVRGRQVRSSAVTVPTIVNTWSFAAAFSDTMRRMVARFALAGTGLTVAKTPSGNPSMRSGISLVTPRRSAFTTNSVVLAGETELVGNATTANLNGSVRKNGEPGNIAVRNRGILVTVSGTGAATCSATVAPSTVASARIISRRVETSAL